VQNLNWTEEEIYLIAERGHSLHLEGQYREACVIFQGLVAVDPENPYAAESLAAAWLALGEHQRAIEQLNALLTKQPADLAVRAKRLQAYLMSGNLTPAIQDFEFLEHLLPAHEARRLELSLQSFGYRTASANSRRSNVENSSVEQQSEPADDN
jgi:predicted Zn-dependent protease